MRLSRPAWAADGRRRGYACPRMGAVSGPLLFLLELSLLLVPYFTPEKLSNF
jgi:hypothetical protein